MKYQAMKYKKFFFFAALLLFTGLFSFRFNDRYFEIAKNLDIFATLFREINSYYVDEVSPSELMEAAIDNMLAGLDPYTNYIPEDQIEDYRTAHTGQYAGIGANIGMRNDKCYILMPFENSPAQKAGLKIGDVILKIDGTDVTKKNSNDISKLLKGQAGTELTLELLRYGQSKPMTIKITREKISIGSVTYFGMVSDDVGLVKLSEFSANASRDIKDAMSKLKEQGAKKIILDLRNNPGGLLHEAVEISNIFVPKGSEIVSTRGKIKEWNKVYKAQNSATDEQIPVAVLTSRTSASASEIVAGVIQDYDRGVVIGENTFGKGLVQATRDLSYNSKLKVTVAKYYTPSGRCIQAIDYSNRNDDGSVGKIPDSLRREFKTRNGRTVLDGGGVKPDIEIEKSKLAPITIALLNKNLLFDFANEYHFKNPELKTGAKEYRVSDAEYKQFTDWLKTKNFDYETTLEKSLHDFEKLAKENKSSEKVLAQIRELEKAIAHNKETDLITFKDEIVRFLKAEILSRYYLERGEFEGSFEFDPDVKKALEVLNNPAEYAAILKGNKK
jgi:carboxyl-terminal processing protease